MLCEGRRTSRLGLRRLWYVLLQQVLCLAKAQAVLAPDALICQSCELQGFDPSPELAPGHLRSHPLASVRDSTVAEKSMTSEARLIGLEKRIATLESNFDDRISTMERRVDERMASIEDVLRLIAGSLAGPAPNHGHGAHQTSRMRAGQDRGAHVYH